MLEVRELTRRFGDLVAVDDVSFTVPAGGLTGFVGGNGAGKTTTMRMIMGLLASHHGEVHWHGRPMTAADRRRIGYMPEERGLYPKQGVLDQLTYLAALRGMATTPARARITDLLERFGLGGRAKEPVQKLSLGNQQRVQIIAALVPQPQALVLDEPFSGLDPDAIEAMTEVLHEQARSGVPIVFSSHQLDLVDRLCERLIVMARGRVVAHGTHEELRAHAPVRYRLLVAGDAGWVRDRPGLRVVDISGGAATVDVLTAGSEQDLLADAVSRDVVREFGRVVPRLSEIYREVTA